MNPISGKINQYQFETMDDAYSPIPSPMQLGVGEYHYRGENCGPPVDLFSVTCCNVAGCIMYMSMVWAMLVDFQNNLFFLFLLSSQFNAKV